MADSGATPPPKEVVTTRTPTPTSPTTGDVHVASPSLKKDEVDLTAPEDSTLNADTEAADLTGGAPAESGNPEVTEQSKSIEDQPKDNVETSTGEATGETATSTDPGSTEEPAADKNDVAQESQPAKDGKVENEENVGDDSVEQAALKASMPEPAEQTTPARSANGSPQQTKSASGTPQPAKSATGTPQPAKSATGTPQPAKSATGTPQPGSQVATPRPAGSKPTTPSGSATTSPQPADSANASSQPSKSVTTPPQQVATPHTAESAGGPAVATTPVEPGSAGGAPLAPDSATATPQAPGSATATPQAPGSTTATPQVPGSATATPQASGSATATPQGPGSATATPLVTEPATATPQVPGFATATPQVPGSATATPQVPGSATATPQVPGSATATPHVAESSAATPQTNVAASLPQSPLKAASKADSSPPPPPTASTGGQQEPSSSSLEYLDGPLPTSAPEKTSLSALSDEDEANMLTGNALNMVWSFGLNKNIPMVNLSTDSRSIIMYACAHTGICYNFASKTQKLLQGHNNNISSICVSEDKRWLATADKGPNNCMVIVWDTSSFFPVQTIFDAGEQGVVAMALTPDARYLATISAGTPQVLCIWDWTVEGDKAICSATLDPGYGVQNFVLFNPDDTTQIVSNGETQVVFYAWGEGSIEYFCPPLTDEDFNKPVGKYTQSIFLENTNKCLTATSIGNLVVWASNKPLTKAVDNEPTPNKKALKLVKVQDRGINVLMVTDSQIVMGDMNGHVKLFDQNLNLIHWYQDLHIGPINSISFTYVEKWGVERMDTQDYPADCSLEANTLTMRNFVIGSTQSIYAQITPKGTDIQVILRNHDSPIHSIVTHPSEKMLFVGSYSGLLQMWDYSTRTIVASRKFEKGYLIQCLAVDPKGHFIAVGFTNGVVKVLDVLNLQDEPTEPFRYARDSITHAQFSHDSQYLATADGEFTVTLYARQHGVDAQPWVYVGRHKSHYKEIMDICFSVELDSNKPRLLTLGKDRNLVEYDLEKSSKDNLRLLSVDRIEQSAIPQCITCYPPLNKEHFLVTANDQFKFKLYNVTTKRCRKTVLGPTYGSPLQKICVLPGSNIESGKGYLAYINKDKIGLQILPLDGNPHNSTALVAHPSGVSNMACSFDGKYLFTAGGTDTSVHMWHINLNALEAQSKLGGEDLIPFYGLMEGGRDGELFAELEDYFYYAQLRNQGINTMMKRSVDTKIALSEVPYVMRAMGFYPSEQEVEDMLNEVKFSKYVETGQDVTDIDLGNFIKLYINHRPAFGLSHEKIAWCFEVLSAKLGDDASIKRGQFLDLLQRKGEHMTEYELSEYLTTLLGFNEEGGSCEQHMFDPTEAGNIIVDNLPLDIYTKSFTDDLLGFGFYQPADVLTVSQENTES